jgi:nitroreductase
MMDAFECVVTKLEIREFDSKAVPPDIKLKILEAARSTGTGMNSQHWRFIVVRDRDRLKKLAEDSTYGKWVQGANFAVVVLTDPKYGFHMLDAGRATQNMQVAAWNFGVASGLYTGINEEAMRKDFAIPQGMKISVVLGFGYPKRRLVGKKDRKPISEVAHLEQYGKPLNTAKL